MQACLLNNQGRSPSGRCLCGGPSPDNGCEPGLQCKAGQCTAAGDNNGWQRWQLNAPWTGYISSASSPREWRQSALFKRGILQRQGLDLEWMLPQWLHMRWRGLF